MRHILQPGPVHPERIQWVEARGRRLGFELAAGKRLLEGVQEGFAAGGFSSGVVNFTGGALGPLAYVMPALSTNPEHAAFYSDIFRPAGTSRLQTGAMTFGMRDGEPFFHCHALWTGADGKFTGGHILPEESFVAETFRVEAMGIDGAAFEARLDPETGFKLFAPVPRPASAIAASQRIFALRLRPNQDFAGALEGFCATHNIRSAVLHGGVGSTIAARFADGRLVEPFATEIALRAGRIAPDRHGQPAASLDIALVNCQGETAQGLLARGHNPVLMTVELVLEAE